MGKIILYHGSPNKVILPQYGLGEDKHDYGKGFYLTEDLQLAKEWAVCRPSETIGWVHKYELDTAELKVLDFQQHNVLSWLAELMRHISTLQKSLCATISILKSLKNCYLLVD